MVKVKPESEIQKNYEDSTALVPGRFEAGVRVAAWQGPALEGQALYEERLRDPDVLSRRARNISKVSDATWRDETISKGKAIIGARMKTAAPEMVSGFRPYRSALEALTLPARTADPMANLMNRAGAVVTAMVDTKKAQG